MIPSAYAGSTERSEELKLRAALVKALDTFPNCDLARRVRKELQRNHDSNTTHYRRKQRFMVDVIRWSEEHLMEAFAKPRTAKLAGEVFDAFMLNHPHYRGSYGKRLFYEVLRREGYTLCKMDAFGNVSESGRLVLLDVELQA